MTQTAPVNAAFGAIEGPDVSADPWESVIAFSSGHPCLIQLDGRVRRPGSRQGELPLHRQLPETVVLRGVAKELVKFRIPHVPRYLAEDDPETFEDLYDEDDDFPMA